VADPSSHIQRVLATLAANSDLVGESMQGLVITGGKRDKGIEALVNVHALTPVEEDTYQLNPRLREYLTDHLARWDAFSRLTRLTSDIAQARVQWRNLRQFAREGLHADAERLSWGLDATITSIGYAMERNLLLLNSNISTDYGNVESLKAKIEQNTHYAREVGDCLREIRSLDEATRNIHDEALSAGNLAVRTLVNTRIRSRLPMWANKLNDIQREIDRRLFAARRLEKRLRNLGKVALWLSRDRLSDGFEVDVDEASAAALCLPENHANGWNIDTRDHDPMVSDGLIAAAARLPVPRAPARPMDEAPPPQVVVATEQSLAVLQREPAELLVEQLLAYVRDHPLEPISLMTWKRQALKGLPEGQGGAGPMTDIPDEHWLLFAASQVASAGINVQLQMQQRRPDLHNDLFHDAIANACGLTTAQRIHPGTLP